MLTSSGVSKNVRAAVLLSALAHFSLAVIIQIENYLTYLATDSLDFFWWLARLPFIQLENIIFAGFLGVLAIGMTSRATWRWTYLVLVVACNAYLAVDQLAYKVFFDHIPYGLLEADYTFQKMLLHLLAQVDAWLVVNSILVAFSAWLLYQVLIRQQTFGIECLDSWASKLVNRPIVQVGVVALGFFSVIIVVNGVHHNLNQHAASKILFSLDGKYRAASSGGNIFYPRFGEELRRYNQALRAFQAAVQQSPRTSVVVITVKFKNGQNARDAIMEVPAIQELLTKGVYFPEVYNPWPSPAHPYAADWLMVSGARAMSSVTRKASNEAYKNTHLARALQQQKYISAFAPATSPVAPADGECFTPARLPITQSLMKLRNSASPQQPFFLSLTTSLSLDTAGCSAGDAMPITSHQRSLLDQDLQALLQYLRASQRFKDTVFVIYGDVSQQTDKENASLLRDDRAKGFAIVSSSRYSGESIVADGVMQLANVNAMLLSFIGEPKGDTPSLLDTEGSARITYFMDGYGTGMWGLRDGNWKFTESTLGGQVALYDLDKDKRETNNLARYYPQRVRLYEQLSAAWYATLNTDLPESKRHFVNVDGRLKRQFESGFPGAKNIVVGYYKGLPNKSKFLPRKVFNPYDPIAVTVDWIAYPKQKQFEFNWLSPSGQSYTYPFMVEAGWLHSWAIPGFGLPMESGVWTLALLDEGQKVMAKDFVVDHNQAQKRQFSAELAVVEQAEVGIYTPAPQPKFVTNPAIHAQRTPILWTRWKPQSDVRFITYRWESAQGIRSEKDYGVRGDWHETWVDYEGPMPLDRGPWRVSILQQGRKIMETQFVVVQ